MSTPAEQGWWPEYLYLEDQIVSDCAFFCDEQGVISRFSRDPSALAKADRLKRRFVIPGLVNGHSHTFQRAIRGRTEVRTTVEPDTFWTWREKMYSAAARLEPQEIYATARMAFLEMVLSGITTVGEFHYLHHQADGTPYPDRNLLAKLIIQAARDVGIRVALLRTAYSRAGFKRAPNPGQARFITPRSDVFIQDTEALFDWVEQEGLTNFVNIGVAPHSFRALPIEYVRAVRGYANQRGIPVHMHVAEQPAEIEQCHAEHGRSPVDLLHEEEILSERFTAIHAIHISEAESQLLARSKCTVCACPTSERNLADGAVPAHWLLREGGQISLGSDSQIQIDLFEDARLLEYHLRMMQLERVVLASKEGHDLAQRLFAMTTKAGARSLCLPVGELAIGRPADFVSIDLDDPSVAGGEPGALLEQLLFSAERSAVREVFVQGKAIVQESRHDGQTDIVGQFVKLQQRLWRDEGDR
ncbi:MAG TPA: formimidoylglutamate deiminase [Chthoniobacterales bacterium]|nr:formimidoylglutamate deiminase [Chthoniobacterales bacterium]